MQRRHSYLGVCILVVPGILVGGTGTLGQGTSPSDVPPGEKRRAEPDSPKPDPTARAESSNQHRFELRIVADRTRDRVSAERALGPDGAKKPPEGFRWIEFKEHGAYREGLILRKGEPTPVGPREYLLVKLGPDDVTERDLASVEKAEGERSPSIRFRLTPDGSRRLGALTKSHLPEDQGLFKYRIAVIVEDAVHATPFINSEIRQGAAFEPGPRVSSSEIDRMVKLLAGIASSNDRRK